MEFIKAIAILSAMGVIAGYFGALHPVSDSIAIGRPIAAAALLAAAWAFRSPLRPAMLALSLAALLPILWSLWPGVPVSYLNLRLYQHNLLFTNTAPDLALVAEQQKPDVMTLQEIKAGRGAIDALEGYPYQQICTFEAIGDTGILSRLPFLDQGCAEGGYRGFAWAKLDVGGKPVIVVSIHLHWPYPYGQAAQLDEILPQIEALPKPVIVAGDFNQVPWSHAVRSVASAIEGDVSNPLMLTLVRPPIFLPIDHILSPFETHIEKLDRYGSDHNGLLADFEF